jgi:hypothetical protein
MTGLGFGQASPHGRRGQGEWQAFQDFKTLVSVAPLPRHGAVAGYERSA